MKCLVDAVEYIRAQSDKSVGREIIIFVLKIVINSKYNFYKAYELLIRQNIINCDNRETK